MYSITSYVSILGIIGVPDRMGVRFMDTKGLSVYSIETSVQENVKVLYSMHLDLAPTVCKSVLGRPLL